jgi:glycerate kinase
MNTLKSLGVILMLCLSLLLSGVACVLIAVSLKQPSPNADVVVAGVGNSGNSLAAGFSPRRLARAAVERKVAPTVDDATLQNTVDALVTRAKQGDAEAAAFVFELAAAQRQNAK